MQQDTHLVLFSDYSQMFKLTSSDHCLLQLRSTLPCSSTTKGKQKSMRVPWFLVFEQSNNLKRRFCTCRSKLCLGRLSISLTWWKISGKVFAISLGVWLFLKKNSTNTQCLDIYVDNTLYWQSTSNLSKPTL